jgi:hypothetical protein
MGVEIEKEAAAKRKRTGAEPFGAAKILAQHPWTRPARVKKSPAPLLQAASKAVRQVFYEGFALLVAAYRTAAEKLQRGDPNPGLPLRVLPARAAIRGRVDRAPKFSPWLGSAFVRLDKGRKGEVCLERRFGVNFRKSMSPDWCSGEARGLFRAALGGLTSGKRPRERTIFSRDVALRGWREYALIRAAAPFSPIASCANVL